MIHIPESPLLTGAEAAVYLRLCAPDAEPDEVGRAVEAVKRLVRAKKLRAIRPGRSYAYPLVELDRYVQNETADFEPQSDAHK